MAQWWKPYEAILEEKPKAIKDVLCTEIAKELLEFCEQFPPNKNDIDFLDNHLAKRFEDKFEFMPQIDLPFLVMICQLLKLELEYDIEAVDHFFRNGLYKEVCQTELHLEALHFIKPVLLEMLFQRKEDCKGNLKNKDLIIIVERLEQRFRKKHGRVIIL